MLHEGTEYKTRDGKVVTVVKTLTGSFQANEIKRYFTPDGKCIAYWRGDEPIIEDTRSIVMPPADPEADIVNEIHADEEAAQDPHTWIGLPTSESPGLMLSHEWCSDCGALRTTTTRGATAAIQINTPNNYNTCGKRRR